MQNVCRECTLQERAERPHNSQHIAAGGEILFMDKKSPVLIVLSVTDGIQGSATLSKD